jgi:hypothetical protein
LHHGRGLEGGLLAREGNPWDLRRKAELIELVVFAFAVVDKLLENVDAIFPQFGIESSSLGIV